MKIIVGLGNPGPKYKLTRHNFGFMAVDALAEKLGAAWRENKRLKSLVAKSGELLLLKPQTFINLSGEAVAAALKYNKAATASLTVLHDDIDINFGKFKIATDSRSAGHNGVQSIIDHLKTQDFTRYRLGVKNDKLTLMGAEKFVLDKFSKEEIAAVNQLCSEVAGEILKQKNSLQSYA